MYDISILVDTHSTKQREKQWQHEWGYISRFSSHSSASRGVAVLFKNSFEFHINQEIIDECGNFIILDINIQDYRMTLVAIYGPNEDNPDFFKKLVFNINQFDNSSVIIAGDWNVVQDYRVDILSIIIPSLNWKFIK
jgi:exonuclease III